MKLFHPSDIYEESWLLLGVTKLLGLYPIRFFKYTCTNYIYGIMLIMLYGSFHLYIMYYMQRMFVAFISTNNAFTLKEVRYYLNIFMFPTIIISSICQTSKIKEVFERIDSVDQNIKFINIEIDHTLCMKNDIVQIFTTMFIVTISNMMDFYGIIDNDSRTLYFFHWVADRLPDFFNVIIISSFIVFINKIAFRFKKINTILNIITEGKCVVSVSTMSDVNNVFRYKLLKSLRLKLCKTVAVLNEAYGFRFKILTMVYITYICLHVCVVYIHINEQFYMIDVFMSLVWGILDLFKLVHLMKLYRSLTLEYI